MHGKGNKGIEGERLRAAGAALLVLSGSFGCAPPVETAEPGVTRTTLASPQSWIEGAPIRGSDPAAGTFGLAIAARADRVAIGAENSAEVFVRSGDAWTSEAILPLPGVQQVASAALFGDDLLLETDSSEGGRVLHYTRSGTWSEPKILDPGRPAKAGHAVALGQDVAVVGSKDVGLAFVFERGAGGFALVQTLEGNPGSDFGSSVAISGQEVLVGAPGEVLATDRSGVVKCYRKQAGTWLESNELKAPSGHRFGAEIAANAQRLASLGLGGTVQVFERVSDGWAAPVALGPPTGIVDGLASSVAIGDAVLIVGMSLETQEGEPGAGRAYISLGKGAELSAPIFLDYGGAGPGDHAGHAVAVALDIAFVAAPYARVDRRRGQVRTFRPCQSDAECPALQYCNAIGACETSRQTGAPCAGECREPGCRVCTSLACVDGICCDGPCDGQCEACTEPGREGRCVPVAEPRAGKSCGSAGPCGGSCNGTSPDCVFPAVGVSCASECADGVVTGSECDGRGVCAPRAPRSCSGFACQGNQCATQCAGDSDCVDGFLCAEGACVAVRGAACSDDAKASLGPDGTTQCFPYVCDRAHGTCVLACASTADCAASYLCDAATRACVPAADVADEGCSCRIHARSGGGLWCLVTASILCAAASRLRRRR